MSLKDKDEYGFNTDILDPYNVKSFSEFTKFLIVITIIGEGNEEKCKYLKIK